MTYSVAAFEGGLLEVFKPKDTLTPLEWMAQNCKVLPGIVGQFDPAHTPWLKAPINATFDPEVRTVVNMAAVGSGKSIYICVSTAYILAKGQGDVLVYQPTNPNAKDFFRSNLRKVWEGCPPIASMLPTGKDVTWSCQRINRSTIWTLGADAEANLQRYHVRWVFLDEVWQYKPGHLKQAQARNLSFGWLAKTAMVGQAGIKGDDFDRQWETSTQEEYSWRCPHCSTVQPWDWDMIKIPSGGLTADGINEELIAQQTKMACRSCGHLFDDNDSVRAELNATAATINGGTGFVQMNHNARKSNRGFHWNALPARSWGETAIDWARAKIAQTNGDETPMQIFRMKQLALPYSSEIMDSTDEVSPGAFKMREEWEDEGAFDLQTKQVVATRDETKEGQARLRFIGVDCQRDGFYCVCRSWAADGRSRLYDWAYFHTVEEVEAFRKKCGVIAPFTFVDSGDQQDFIHRTAARLGWNCTRGTRKADFPWPSRMMDGTTKVKSRPYSKPREVEPFKGMLTRVYYFGNLPFKDLLWRLRRSGVHQYALDAGEDYTKQMAAERRIKTPAGIPIWKAPKGRANHIWDCEVIILLPALVFGLAGEGKNTAGNADVKDPPTEQDADDDEAPTDN